VPKKLEKTKIEEIKRDLDNNIRITEVARRNNVSATTVTRVATGNYFSKRDEIKVIHNARVPKEILIFYEKRKMFINQMKKMQEEKVIFVKTCCYDKGCRFKRFKIKFLNRNCDIFYFINLENNRVLYFKFGDFLTQDIFIEKFGINS
jgi:hypothetical protein